MKYCENCGAKLEDDAVFCEECGHKAEAKTQGKEDTVVENKGMHTSKSSVINSSNESETKKNILVPILCGIIGILVMVIIVIIIIMCRKPGNNNKNESNAVTSLQSTEQTTVANKKETVTTTEATTQATTEATTQATTEAATEATTQATTEATTEATTISNDVRIKELIIGSWTSYTGGDPIMEYSSKYTLVFNSDGSVSCKGYRNNHSGEYNVDSDGNIICNFTNCIDSFAPMGPTEIPGYTSVFIINADGTLSSTTGSNGTTNWGTNTVWTKM